jgi:hypothetical protein
VQLTAVFESWHVGDGNYPPLRRGQLVRLSFELEPTQLASCALEADESLRHLGDGEYAGVGRVLRTYSVDGEHIVVIEADGFRFYVLRDARPPVKVDDAVEFAGTLLLDHHMWVEFLHTYAAPPDLFLNLRVSRIRKVEIPERFVSRSDRSKSLPTRVGPKDFGAVVDLDTMEGQPFDEEFYLLDLDGSGLQGVEVARTFL